MNLPDDDDSLDNLLVLLGTIIIGLGFGLLYTYREYRFYVETLMIIKNVGETQWYF
jgi:hypothetical protein